MVSAVGLYRHGHWSSECYHRYLDFRLACCVYTICISCNILIEVMSMFECIVGRRRDETELFLFWVDYNEIQSS